MVVGDESTAARTHSTAISPDVRQSAAVAVARFFFFFLAAPSGPASSFFFLRP
jgi:hypothetical protein